MNAVLIYTLSAIGLSAGFLLAYAWCRRANYFSWVDVIWSYAFVVLVAVWAMIGQGWDLRRATALALIAFWGLRLGTHLLMRLRRHYPVEDGRYETMRKKWGDKFASKMAGFFILQAISVLVLVWPFNLVCNYVSTTFSPAEWAGILIALLGMGGEWLADRQLADFKKENSEKGAVCERGLWSRSRHPNYFFEWIIWVGFSVFASTAAGPFAFVSALIMLVLLLKVSGVPPTEEQALKSKGDAYRRYQERVPAFFPRLW